MSLNQNANVTKPRTNWNKDDIRFALVKWSTGVNNYNVIAMTDVEFKPEGYENVEVRAKWKGSKCLATVQHIGNSILKYLSD